MVELLVSIAMVATLTAVLIPATSKARSYSNTATCSSSMRQIGTALAQFQQDNRGQLFPRGGRKAVTELTNPDYLAEWPGVDRFVMWWPSYVDEYLGGDGRHHPPVTTAPIKRGVVTSRVWLCPSNLQSQVPGGFDIQDDLANYDCVPGHHLGKAGCVALFARRASGDDAGYQMVPDADADPSAEKGVRIDRIRRPSDLLYVVETSDKDATVSTNNGAWYNPIYQDFYPYTTPRDPQGIMARHAGGGNQLFVDQHVQLIRLPTAVGEPPAHPLCAAQRNVFEPYWSWLWQ